MMQKCCTNVNIFFSRLNLHISLQVSIHSPLVVYVAKGFYGTTEISVAKVSRKRTANAELAYCATVDRPTPSGRWTLIIC